MIPMSHVLREFVAARQWIAARQVIDPARAADSALAVRQIVDLPVTASPPAV